MKRTHYTAMTLLLVLGFVLVGAFNLDDYGMGWDEVTRWNSGDLKVEYYKAVIAGNAGGFANRLSGDRYPGLFDMPLSLIHELTGWDRMLTGHAMSLGFAAVGLLATAWLAAIVFGWQTAFVATLFLALLPNFYGHAMINPKDIPFMAMYTLGLGAVLYVSRNVWENGKLTIKDAFLAGICAGLAASSRVPGMVLLGLGGGIWAFALLWGYFRQKHPIHPIKGVLNLVWGSALAGLSAFLVLFLFFPRLHFQALQGIAKVSGSLHSSANKIPLLYKGEAMNAADGPATYAHHMLMVTTPFLLFILMLAGLGLISFKLKQAYENESCLFQRFASFLALALFPWLYVLVANPALHNGIRHMLWAIPPLIILAAYSFTRGQSWIARHYPKYAMLGPAVLAGFALFQTAQLYRSHPYEYVSFNFLAGDKGTVINRYEGEYWFTSTKHLLEALPSVVPQNPAGSPPVRVRLSGPIQCAYPFVPKGFALTDSFADAEYYISNTTFRSDLLAEGEIVYEIESNGIPIGVIKNLMKGRSLPDSDADIPSQ